jgi:hypothetical protein
MKDKLQYVNTVNTIVARAEADLLEATGIGLRLMVVGRIPPDADALGMAQVICHALGFTLEDLKNGSRKQQYCHLRHLCCYFMKEYYPDLSLMAINRIMGRAQDHTTTIHSINYAKELIMHEDEIFLPKYEQCLQAITQWTEL